MKPFVKDNLRFVLEGKKILLGITGGIAAFKACDIIRYLRQSGAAVKVVMSQGAENFVTKTTLETLSGNPVLSGFWDTQGSEHSFGTHHIETARWADLILVAPATANFLAKAAHGMADDLLLTEILAFKGPLLIAPAMNPAMYSHPAVQENVSRLRSRQVQFVGPENGIMACGEEGLGRMSEPEQIVEACAEVFYAPSSKRLLITLGPTRSAIDPVRFISNRSSGLMGAALCWAAVQKGYQVTAICGPTQVDLPQGIEVIRVQTAREMAEAALGIWPRSDVFIASAAVLDWDVQNPSSFKLKKSQGSPQIQFAKNPDILALISKECGPHQFVLGFAAETENPVEQGFQKLKEKGCHAVFANDVSLAGQGFESEQNGGWWLSLPDQVTQIPTCSKLELARKLMERIGARTESPSPSPH